MTQNHTPTPWIVSSPDAGETITILHDQGDGYGVAVCSMDTTNNRDEQNAAFIVRACNSHAALVEALTHARALVIASEADRTENQTAIAMYDRALALAKGE